MRTRPTSATVGQMHPEYPTCTCVPEGGAEQDHLGGLVVDQSEEQQC
jgi:hypothetical protein